MSRSLAHDHGVSVLVDMGFSAAVSSSVLTECDGQVDIALEPLLCGAQHTSPQFEVPAASSIAAALLNSTICIDSDDDTPAQAKSQQIAMTRLTEMGFTARECSVALEAANGDVEAALDRLLGVPPIVPPSHSCSLGNSDEEMEASDVGLTGDIDQFVERFFQTSV